MSKTRNLSDLLDANGDVKSGALDNVPSPNLTGIDDNATSTAVTIESDGDVLISKTSNSLGTVGVELASNGKISATRSGDPAMSLNRLSTDGQILDFRKDTTTVGSIGTQGGTLEIGSGDVYLQFNGANDWIKPVDGSGNNKSGVDLGTSGAKFDNLYLGGNIYLGGTGSANALDDYEEGTFTVGVDYGTITNTTGHYTKIGNQVTVRLNPQSFSDRTTNAPVKLSGFPFQCFSTYAGGVMNRYVNVSTKPQIVWYMGNNYNYVYLFACGTNGDWQQVQHDDLDSSTAEFYVTATYFTNS